MMAEMPVSVFDGWFKYYMDEPWGYELEMAHHAEVCSYLVNGLFHPKTPVKASDFYPEKLNPDIDPDADQDWKEMYSLLKGQTSG